MQKEFVTVTPDTSGPGAVNVSFQVPENNTGEARKVEVNVTSKSGNIIKTVVVEQPPKILQITIKGSLIKLGATYDPYWEATLEKEVNQDITIKFSVTITEVDNRPGDNVTETITIPKNELYKYYKPGYGSSTYKGFSNYKLISISPEITSFNERLEVIFT